MISGFHRGVKEIFALLGFYTVENGFPTFQDNVSVTSSRVKQSKKNIA
jgi:hypothetical protein